jgi:hypothetical protein
VRWADSDMAVSELASADLAAWVDIKARQLQYRCAKRQQYSAAAGSLRLARQ